MDFEKIIAKIRAGKTWRFHGGIHPAEHKDESSESPIERLEPASVYIVPVRQTGERLFAHRCEPSRGFCNGSHTTSDSAYQRHDAYCRRCHDMLKKTRDTAHPIGVCLCLLL